MSSDNETPGGRSPRARKTTAARRPAAPRSRTGAAERTDRGEGERLQKVLAHAGVGSRRACEELILQGRVTVDGKVARELGTRVDPARSKVAVDGQRVTPGHLGYLGRGHDELPVATDDVATVLLIGGAPFEEELRMWWNFVARTREEIRAARDQWMADDGRFGSVGSALPRIPVDPPPWAAAET